MAANLANAMVSMVNMKGLKGEGAIGATDGWPSEPELPSNFGPPVPTYSIVLACLWFLPVLIYWGLDFVLTRRRRTVQELIPEIVQQNRLPHRESELRNIVSSRSQEALFTGGEQSGARHFPVMLASIEHSLPHLPKCRATAGGLGKVVDLIARKHPSDILLVHPMLKDIPGSLEYGKALDEQAPLRLVVEDVRHDVRVFRYVPEEDPPDQPHVEFLMLSHPLFEARGLDGIYPNPMSRKNVLAFFSLWNQAVGALLVRHKPEVYHCPDFHTAVAPWYALRGHPNLKVLLVLHNAEYQGTVSTDMILGHRLDRIASVWNLPKEIVKKHLLLDGRFNMLKAVVDFILEHQNGLGVCAVSQWYAAECHAQYGVLWELPVVYGLDNPMLEEERVSISGNLAEAKADAKQKIQKRFGLEQNPNARLFVSLGRLVRQKGVDLIADVADWLLSHFSDAQLILVGPVGDGFGHYAATKLEALKDRGRHTGRLHVHIQFLRDKEALKEMKLGADFCLMPSRDEPFGYVDIEFAWHGALLVGAQAGGLGKVPGFYFLAQNRENLDRLRKELRTAVKRAMDAPTHQLHRMAEEAVSCTFPLDIWQKRLRTAYRLVLGREPQMAADPNPTLQCSPTRRTSDPDGFDAIVHAPPGSSIALTDASPAARSRASTFKPFAENAILPPRPDGDRDARRSTAPVSFVDNAVAHGRGSNASFAPSDSEFLTQELDEEELAERVKQKVQLHESWGIDEILVSVGEDVNFEREPDAVARWLLSRTAGVQRIHIIVALGYVASPIAEFLTFVMATEWGLRGGESVPIWAQRLLGTQIDPPILSMALFGINALAFAVSAPMWAALCRYIEPRRVMAICLLLQVPLLITIFPVYPRIEMALLLVFLHGMVTSGSFLFLVFNFMMSIKADMSEYAVRLGALEMMRYVVTWLLTGYIFVASPSSKMGTKEQPIPTSISLLLLPVGLIMILLTAIPGGLLFFAPGPYRGDRFPAWNLDLIYQKRSFILLLISDCVGSLALFPGTCYITWWLSNGWSSANLSRLSVLFAFILAGGTFLWAAALKNASVHGFSFLIGVALMLAPATMLRELVQDEVSTITSLGRSQVALVVGVLSLFLEGVRESAIWTVKIRILNSRWRLLSYGTVNQVCSHFCAFLSPIVCEILARMNGVTFITRNQKELADAMIISGLPLGLLQFFCQVAIAPFIKKDMGINVGAERTRSMLRLFRKGTTVFAFSTLIGASIVLLSLTFLFLKNEMPVARYARCVEPHEPVNCTVIVDESNKAPAVLGWHYGPNKFGQNTTGLYNCMQRMNIVGGDTFLYWEVGRCQVRSCGSKDALMKGAGSAGKESGFDLFSRFCDMARPDLVATHLFEWPWTDIGRECESYLGPAGFTAVQISPPVEHILGDSWVTRYQPVSYRFESRSGSYLDFVDMVRRCRAAGVNVMVDAVLNHMAPPVVFTPKKDRGKACGRAVDTEKESTAKCMGWAGTEYESRNYPNGLNYRRDREANKYTRDSFHHYSDNKEANCGLPPFSNNRRLCDMYGMPDLNTEDKEVQQHIGTYLFDLFEIGVNMIRVDAAIFIYPESLAQIILPFPWEFVVQEYYTELFKDGKTVEKALSIGAATEFSYGERMAQILFDSFKDNTWNNRSNHFGELLQLHQYGFSGCSYSKECSSPYPTDRAMMFIDNHDQQRERWKPDPKGRWPPPESPVCYWDGRDIGGCRPLYKHGQIYSLAMMFMILWPYGDPRPSLRIMSSYEFETFHEGPPGIRPDSLHDSPMSPVRCKQRPDYSPVTDVYDKDKLNPWVCEHRWAGISGCLRFRQFSNQSQKVHSQWDDGEGHIAFSLGNVGFAALSRGYNWYTGQGSNETIPLKGRKTGLPQGCYCNLADEPGAVPDPDTWKSQGQHCAGDIVEIGNASEVVRGELPSGHAVAIHVMYPSNCQHAEVEDVEEMLMV